MKFPRRDVGGFERSQTVDIGTVAPVGKGEPGPLASSDPPVTKKLGTPEGKKALPVVMNQLVTAWLMWNGDEPVDPGVFTYTVVSQSPFVPEVAPGEL